MLIIFIYLNIKINITDINNLHNFSSEKIKNTFTKVYDNIQKIGYNIYIQLPSNNNENTIFRTNNILINFNKKAIQNSKCNNFVKTINSLYILQRMLVNNNNNNNSFRLINKKTIKNINAQQIKNNTKTDEHLTLQIVLYIDNKKISKIEKCKQFTNLTLLFNAKNEYCFTYDVKNTDRTLFTLFIQLIILNNLFTDEYNILKKNKQQFKNIIIKTIKKNLPCVLPYLITKKIKYKNNDIIHTIENIYENFKELSNIEKIYYKYKKETHHYYLLLIILIIIIIFIYCINIIKNKHNKQINNIIILIVYLINLLFIIFIYKQKKDIKKLLHDHFMFVKLLEL